MGREGEIGNEWGVFIGRKMGKGGSRHQKQKWLDYF